MGSTERGLKLNSGNLERELGGIGKARATSLYTYGEVAKPHRKRPTNAAELYDLHHITMKGGYF